MSENTTTMSFASWLIERLNDANPTGDLARDVVWEGGYPANGDEQTWATYLEQHDASDRVLKAFRKAWRAYCKEVPQ